MIAFDTADAAPRQDEVRSPRLESVGSAHRQCVIVSVISGVSKVDDFCNHTTAQHGFTSYPMILEPLVAVGWPSTESRIGGPARSGRIRLGRRRVTPVMFATREVDVVADEQDAV